MNQGRKVQLGYHKSGLLCNIFYLQLKTNIIQILGMSWKTIYVVLIYIAATGYCQTTTTIPTISKSELRCRGLGINCKENIKVNRCPTNQECVSEHLCIACKLPN